MSTAVVERPPVDQSDRVVDETIQELKNSGQQPDVKDTTVENKKDDTAVKIEKPAKPERPAAPTGDTVHNVTVVDKNSGKKIQFDFIVDSKVKFGVADDKANAWASKLLDNDWAGAILAIEKSHDGPVAIYIEGADMGPRRRAKTAGVLLNNAYKALAAAGKIAVDTAKGYKYVAVNYPTKKAGEVPCTRLFKMY